MLRFGSYAGTILLCRNFSFLGFDFVRLFFVWTVIVEYETSEGTTKIWGGGGYFLCSVT